MASWRAGAPETSGHKSLVGLQYLRGIAAIAVVVDHSAGMLAEAKYKGHALALGGLMETGWTGVQYFFCLSGFIIAYIGLTPALTPSTTATLFARRRFDRIVPYMWLSILAFAAFRLAFRGAFPLGGYLRALSLWPIGHMEPSNIWTLRHEALFYLLFAVTFLARPKLKPLMAVWVLSPLLVLATGLRFWPLPAELILLFGFLFSPVNLLFGGGLILGVAYLKTGDRWPRLPGWMLGVVLIAAGPVIWLFHGRPDGLLGTLCMLPFCMAAVAVAASVRPHTGWISRVGKLLGDASYSIYLMQGLFIPFTLGLLSHRLNGEAVFLLACFAGIGGGIASHFLIERPMVDFLNALRLRGRKAGRAVSAP